MFEAKYFLLLVVNFIRVAPQGKPCRDFVSRPFRSRASQSISAGGVGFRVEGGGVRVFGLGVFVHSCYRFLV